MNVVGACDPQLYKPITVILKTLDITCKSNWIEQQIPKVYTTKLNTAFSEVYPSPHDH